MKIDICKSCGREIPHNSIYCNWCGTKQINEANSVNVPKPNKLKNGYSAQLMINGKRVTVKGNTEAEYYKKAREVKIKADSLNAPVKSAKLSAVIDDYISKNSNVLSPTSIRGYRIIQRNRFIDYHDKKIDKIDYQRMINDEILECSPKTLKSAWGLVKASLNDYGFTPPKVHLPQIPPKEQKYFDEEQLKKFLDAIKGNKYELVYLLCLHSCRVSEARGLKAKDITEDGIKISGSVVPDENNNLIAKKTNKNATSNRTIPILIPRVLELVPKKNGYILEGNEQGWRKELVRICKNNDLPILSLHDLRRTAATFFYSAGVSERTLQALGGWSNNSATIHKIYVQLTQSQINDDVEKIKSKLEF